MLTRILRRERFSDQEIIMEKDKTYVKNILDPEFSVLDYFCHKKHYLQLFGLGDSPFLGDTDVENQVLFMQ